MAINFIKYKKDIEEKGFTVLPDIYNESEIRKITSCINTAETDKSNFRKSSGLFAIRKFLKEIPATKQLIFNDKLLSVINSLLGQNYSVVKSIYFDKPEKSNWFVAWHQDLSISVNNKANITGYNSWTKKQDQFAVQPPVALLHNIYTIRIHLDDTNEGNGALKILPGSHANGIIRPETIDWNAENTAYCNVNAGDIMIMKPLLLHSSDRTVNNKQRRVIHIEFSEIQLPADIEWAEFLEI